MGLGLHAMCCSVLQCVAVLCSGKYESETIVSTLEYRDDTPDALEVRVYS